MINAISAIQAVGEAFGGFGMLTLGPVQFQPIELPKSMPVGGTQDVVKHKFPGGAKQFDIMGPDDPDKSWTGVFFGQDASTRIRLIDAIRKSGQVVTLAWDVFSFQVIVTAFNADTRSNDAMPYKINCLVVQDNSATNGNSLTTLASQVVADLTLGSPMAALGAISNGVVAGPFGAAVGACSLPNATTVGSAAYTAAVADVTAASAAINGALATVNTTLGSYGTSLAALGLASTTPISASPAIALITAAVGAAGDAANLTQMRGYVARVGSNLMNASA